MTDWTRVPVLIGAGQFTSREEDPVAAPDPLALMEIAARQALGPVPADALTHCFMIHSLSLTHGDPARALAERLGAAGAEARCSGMGGSIPQWIVNRAAEMVMEGHNPVVLIAGAEALATRRRATKSGVKLDWPSTDGWPDTWPPLETDLGVHRVERAHGLDQATTMYALIESALAHATGASPTDHARVMGELMERFNAVAVSNPESWFPVKRSAQEIVEVKAENRMISWPYPKYVNAVMDVDMGAAVVLTDAATARRLGCDPDQLVYLSGWADVHDIWYLSQRPAIHRSNALSACGDAAAAMASVALDDIEAFDLYSCFPSSIEVARDSFGVTAGDPRPLTLTGGLPYHGGPGSNYVTHSIANAKKWLNDEQGDHVLVHGNGYYLTKHSVGIYSRRPSNGPPASGPDLQGLVDAAAAPLEVERHLADQGSPVAAEVVAYTVPFGRDGDPGSGIVLVEAGGVRTVARAERRLTEAMLREDAVGWKVAVSVEPAAEEGRKATNSASL